MLDERIAGISRIFGLDAIVRNEVWQHVIEAIEEYTVKVAERPVAPRLEPGRIRQLVSMVDFNEPQEPHDILEFVTGGFWEHQVHTLHPHYFGRFDAAPSTMGVVADALVAAFNPRLSSWNHSPFSNEVDRHVLTSLGHRFGYEEESGLSGLFTSGRAEANRMALLSALERFHPGEYRSGGLRGLPARPLLYITEETHHSLIEAARSCGLGDEAVRLVPVDGKRRMDPVALRRMVADDRAAGHRPLMLVGTVGTDGSGAIDPLELLAGIAADERLWFHADAAWGGAAVLVPELARLLQGIHLADSITFDAHQALAVPVGAGVFLTRHPAVLERISGCAAGEQPAGGRAGLTVFLTLAVSGWERCAVAVRNQVAMGTHLRRRLEDAGWDPVNHSPLPVVCFVDRQHPAGTTARYLEDLAAGVVASGEAWLSSVNLGGSVFALRACIANHNTDEVDVAALLDTLERARTALRSFS